MDYGMTGPALDASAVTGFKAGVGDAVSTLQSSLNNQYAGEIAILFIGIAVIVGFLLWILHHHRGGGSLGGGRGWDGKMNAGGMSLADYTAIKSVEDKSGWDSPMAVAARARYSSR